MPAFTFEKIAPPIASGSDAPVDKNVPPLEKKQRGVIVQIVGRFVEKRVQRVEQRIISGRKQRKGE